MTLRVRPSLTVNDITGKDIISVDKEDKEIYIVTKRILSVSKRTRQKHYYHCPKLSKYLFDSLLANGLIIKCNENDQYIKYKFVKNLPKEYGANRMTISEVIW